MRFYIVFIFIILVLGKSVHPSFDYQDISPKNYDFKVGGIDFLSDGRMVVSTWDKIGAVWIISNYDDPQKIEYKRFASGLQEPLGVKVVNDEIYVCQKNELTLLKDTDKDGVCDSYICISNAWEVSSNFHEFTFGPVYKDGYFYIALAIAINPGGATTNPQKKDRGCLIKIDPKTGEYEVISAGLRTPNGVSINDKGEIFVTDNQGDWLPASKIIHIKKGRFFENRYNPLHPWANKKATQPLAWLPQGEIGNSPSEISFFPEGVFKGQMILPDVHNGGLKRVFLDKVNNEYQGAVFGFIHGKKLRAGINRIAVGQDNNIYLGGIGTRGNWKSRYGGVNGLMKLSFNKNDSFEILAVRSKADGFEIEFTEPLGEHLGWHKNFYDIEQWTYTPTQKYGGPKIDNHSLNIKRVSISSDRRKVALKVDGLKKNYIVHLVINKKLLSSSGKKLWSNFCYYTLNNISNKEGFISKKPSYYTSIFRVNEKVQTKDQEVFKNLCSTCHQEDNHIIAPNLANIFGKERIVITNGKERKIKVDKQYIIDSIINPNKDIVKGYQPVMPLIAKTLSEDVLQGLINLVYQKSNPNKLTKKEKKEGWKLLFDGKNLDGWRNYRSKSLNKAWQIDDFNLHLSKGGGRDIVYDKIFKDFELKLQWKISRGGNSGVFFRVNEKYKRPWESGVEMQVLDNVNGGNSGSKTLAGSLYGLVGIDKNIFTGANEWQDSRVLFQGDNIKIFLNGVKTVDLDLSSPKGKELINNSKFAKFAGFAKASEGFISLQDHGNKVWYRNIKIREL